MGAKILVDKGSGEGHYIKSERFHKTMEEVWKYVYKKDIFTTAEEKILNRLSMFLQINTNAIVAPNGDYMSIEKMAEETYVERSHIRKVIKKLMEKNALGMWKSGNYEIYYMNPFLYQKGFIKPYLFGLFDEEVHARSKKEHLKKLMAGKKVTSILVIKPESKEKNNKKAV